MPIDYSKWNKIELSDDSDIEVHPNVDKQSFIKWKQRDIHEKRHERNIQIKTMLVQLTMYTKLNARVDYLLKTLSASELLDVTKVMSVLNAHFDKNERFDFDKLKEEKGSELRKGLRDLTFDKEEIANTPTYNEMIEDLFSQIKEDHPEVMINGEKLIEHLREHRRKIDDVLLKQTISLDNLLYEKSLLISSDDYHTGFDRSFLNKDEDKEKPAETPKAKAKESVTTVETINSPQKSKKVEKTDQELYDELEVLPATAEFARIPYKDLRKSAEFLVRHPSICTENQKDSLIMTAFDFELQGDTAGARQVIYQSLLLQYISQLSGPGSSNDLKIRAIKLFFSKLEDTRAPASQAFLADVENTVNHIKNRCAILKQENEQNDEGEEQLIQLKSLDESTELVVNPPEEGTEQYVSFLTKLSPEMQTAIRSGSLEEVNKIFATMKIDDAEKALEVFNECGVIGISGVLENEQEFEQLKHDYEEKNLKEEGLNTVDTVDTVD
ncbi:CIC11C00000003103 [Sungouiella intermedia]|uniref:Hsp90 chaperone protein kinase-targeting subunit n=1 Tax=Sungouiella intermedia TaxID=45354 RepID=A0A1L0CXP9_9ASCO|nr:CIC11C00000003103 [[Candida] intermedia]